MARWLSDAGLAVRTDAMGNTYATRPGRRADLPAIAIASHLRFRAAGRALRRHGGVVAGVEVVRLLDTAGIQTDHPLTVIAFSAEEGARFGEACIGSKAVAGVLSPATCSACATARA